MFKRESQFLLVLFCIVTFARCHTAPEKKAIHFEVLEAGPVNDSLSAHRPNYREDFIQWKSVYEQCMHDTLFPNAFYLGLQNRVGIGSISNQVVQNVNREITILDTSGKSDIFNILAVNNSANCFSKINLNKNLQDTFYNELNRNLKSAGDYSYLSGLMDTSQIIFNVSALIDFAIRKDSLVSLLQRTKDSSLLYFRQILTTPGNVLLVRAVMIFGFDAQFHLKKRLSPGEEGKLKNVVYFKLGDHGEKGIIQLLPDDNVKVVINKNYTVFGEFYSFK
jgi:hypothetical protein